MNEATFIDCLESWETKGSGDVYWPDLAEKWGYDSPEILRQAFKRERKKRGYKKEEKKVVRNSYDGVRIGILDVETLPANVFAWGLYDQNIGINQVQKDSCLLSWAGKMLNDSTVRSDIMTPKEAIARKTKRISESVWKFVSGCDILIGHNLVGFDTKVINTEFLVNNLPPVKYVQVDTYLVAKNNFRFLSGKMAFINEKLGIRNKIDNGGFENWKKCSEGDEEALALMLRYNIEDVFATEDLFYVLRPYIRNFNVGLYNETNETVCPVCGSKKLVVSGYYYTSAGKYESVRCTDCNALSRRKHNLLDARKRKSLLINS